jgi:large subunit ribosomal protein L13
MKHIIDAEDKAIGRVAGQAAILLMGKDSAAYSRQKSPSSQIEIINASKLKINEKKLENKKYKRFSGYPSGLREEKLGHLLERRGSAKIMRMAIYGMLPKNKLRDRMMKNLTIKE